MSETSIYVCMRAMDMPIPYVPCHKGKCKRCGLDVYYSKYAYAKDPVIKKIIDSGNLVCVQCATEITKKGDTIQATKATVEEAENWAESTRVADNKP